MKNTPRSRVTGRKKGYLTRLDNPRIKIIDFACNPWSVIEVVDKVYVVTSQLGFEALLAGKDVYCYGAPFYAGWGLTRDTVALSRRRARPSVEQLFAAVYFDYAHYICPERKRRISFEAALDWLTAKRDHAFTGHGQAA